MSIDETSLQTFDCCGLTTRIVSRVIQGCGLGRNPEKSGSMSYREFIPFIIASEAKSTNSSIEYWFRCLDKDDDGVISLHELQWFWEEQFDRMTISRMSEPWKFDDFVCNLYL
jgi:Ca2+-binding EF-hand superfamily protein